MADFKIIETIEEENPISTKEINNLKGIDGQLYNIKIIRYYEKLKFEANIADDLTEIKYKNIYQIEQIYKMSKIFTYHFKSIENVYEFFCNYNEKDFIILTKNEAIELEFKLKSLDKEEKIEIVLKPEKYNIQKVILNFNNKFKELNNLGEKFDKLEKDIEEKIISNEMIKIKKVNEINEKISDLNEKIENQNKIKTKNKMLYIDEIENKIKELDIKFEEQKKCNEENNIKEINKKIDKLYQKLEKHKNKIKENNNLYLKLNELEQKLEEQIALNMKIDNLYINNEKEKKIYDMNKKKEINNLNEEINNLKYDFKREMERKKKEDKNEMDEINQKISKLKKDMKDEINKKNYNINDLESKIENIKIQLETFKNNTLINQLLSKIDDIRTEISNNGFYIVSIVFLMIFVFIRIIIYIDINNVTFKDVNHILNEGIKHNFNKTIKNYTILFNTREDGFLSRDFHNKCDGRSFTATVVITDKRRIFGGFTDLAWDSNSRYIEGDKGFIFSLNKTNNQYKIYYNKNSSKGIYCHKDYGPCFGDNDFTIYDKSNVTFSIDKS